MNNTLDVIVVGAGPAGLMCAKKLAGEGFNVLVLEKREKPNYNKLCGGYIPAPVLTKFNIPVNIAERPIRGAKLVTREGEWLVEFNEVVGYNVNRTRFAEYLAKRVKRKGGDILTNTMVLDVKEYGNSVLVICKDKVFEAKFVVVADGAYSRIGSRIRGRFRLEDLGIAVQVKCDIGERVKEYINYNIILLGKEFSPFGYAYIFPKKEYVDVGVGSLALKATKGILKTYLDKVVDYFNLKPLSKARYAPVPLVGPLENIVKGRILLAGDSAGHVSPLVGEGIKFSMIAGYLAAEAIILSLKHKISVSKVNKYYLSKLRKSFYTRFKIEKFLLKKFLRGELASSSLLKDGRMRRIVAELYLDKRDIKKLLISSLLIYFKKLLKL